MRSLCNVLVPALLAATCFVPGASAATIDFNTLPGTYLSNFSSYTENGFTLTTLTGHFYVDDGTAPLLGDPTPSILSADNLTPERAESLILTKAGGGTFTFDSFQLLATTALPTYEVIGKLGGSKVYDFAGTVVPMPPTLPNDFQALNPGEMSQLVSSVTFKFTQPTDPLNQEDTIFDNFVVDAPATTTSPVPEPGSLYLLGSGLLGIGCVVRRRLME